MPRTLLTTTALLLCAAVVNYAFDPYGAYDTVVNHQPIERALFAANTRLVKAHVVSSYRPQAIVLGTSRAEVGLSPQHPGWGDARVYNLALPQSNMQETVAYLEHAMAAGALETVVVGLDFLQFNPVLAVRPDFDDCRLKTPGSLWSSLRAALCDVPVLLMSRRALIESVAMLGSRPPDIVYLRDGSRDHQAKEAELRRAGSQHAAFLSSEYRYYHDSELLRGYVDSDEGITPSASAPFERLLRFSHRHGLDLRLFISPTHARQQELIHVMGLWDRFVSWKRYILDATYRAAAESGEPPFPLWDFAGYTALTEEPLPPIDDAESRMTWFWESSHYTRSLGDLVLDEVLDGTVTGLGLRVDHGNVDDWIRGIEARRALYQRSAAEELWMMRRHLASPESLPDIPALAGARPAQG